MLSVTWWSSTFVSDWTHFSLKVQFPAVFSCLCREEHRKRGGQVSFSTEKETIHPFVRVMLPPHN